ncbi:hypothetical protein ABTL79_19555, partial [Acinetobacter baumannii]
MTAQTPIATISFIGLPCLPWGCTTASAYAVPAFVCQKLGLNPSDTVQCPWHSRRRWFRGWPGRPP